MDKGIAWSVVFCSSFLLSGSTFAQTSPSGATANARSEIPIREVVLSDGERRYGVEIKVGGTTIEAGLDSGSTGLRILPGVLADSDARGGGGGDSYSYGSGTQFDGEVGTGTLSIGSLSAPATVQLIKTVGCRSVMTQCPAKKVSLAQFGIQGSGLPGEGFKAILGVNMAKADVVSPFPTIGASRWIIELPRPDTGVAGKIVLNPSGDEVKEFTSMPVLTRFSNRKGGLHDSIPGCFLNNDNKQKACGALLMDTGAPGIVVNNGDLGHAPWPNGTAATLAFYAGDKLVAMEQLSIGLRSHASHLTFSENDESGVEIMAGLSPYFAFDVLYDSTKGEVGLKPRLPAPGAPSATVITAPN